MGRRDRRRASGGRARARSGRIPDWVWGAGFGAIVLVFVGFWALLGILGPGSAAGCDEPLVPLGTSDISTSTFANEEVALNRVVEALNRGDRAGAEAQFYGPIHGFTHNVDPPVRQRDESLAKRLCEAVIKVEDGLTTGAGDIELAGSISEVRDILREVAVALGYANPEDDA